MKEITITSQDLIKAAAEAAMKAEPMREIIKAEPGMILTFGIYAGEICTALFGEAEDDPE